MENSLPKNWRWVKLGEACELIMGQSPPSSTYTSEREGLPFFQGKADFGDFYPTVRAWCTHPIKIAEEKDVLISVRAPVGPVNMNNLKCCIGRGLTAIRCKNNAINWFIFWYLRFIEKEITALGSGSTFGAIIRDDLANLGVPLPPLEDQQRIAAKIQELMQEVARAKVSCEKQLESANALPSAYLRQVFESDEAKKWEKAKLRDICKIQTGKRDVNEGKENGRYLFFTCAAEPLRSDTFSFEGESIILPGNGANVGLVIFYNGKFEAYQRTYVLSNFNCLAKYVYYNLKLYWKERNEDKQFGSATNYIKLGNIQNYNISLPSLSMQKSIVDKLDRKIAEMETLQSTLRNQQSTIDALPQSILRKAFRGEL